MSIRKRLRKVGGSAQDYDDVLRYSVFVTGRDVRDAANKHFRIAESIAVRNIQDPEGQLYHYTREVELRERVLRDFPQ